MPSVMRCPYGQNSFESRVRENKLKLYQQNEIFILTDFVLCLMHALAWETTLGFVTSTLKLFVTGNDADGFVLKNYGSA